MTDKEALELLEKTIKIYEIMAKDEAGNNFLEAFKRAVEALKEKVQFENELKGDNQ